MDVRRMAGRVALVGLTLWLIGGPGRVAQAQTVCAVGCPFTSIQAAIDASAAGAVITIGAGTYAEDVTVNKRVTLDGAGNGTSAGSNTIITPVASGLTITAGGSSAAQRLTIQDLRVSGGADSGILLAGPGALAYITVSNVVVDGAHTGLEVPSTLTSLVDLTVQNSTFSDNAYNGLTVIGADVNSATHGGGATRTRMGIVVTGTTFSANGSGGPTGQGYGDVNLFNFNGDASFANVTVNSADSDFAIQIAGLDTNGDGAGPTGLLPASTIGLSDVTVTGTTQQHALLLQLYSDVAAITFADVSLGTSSPAGLTLFEIPATSAALNLGTTTFGSSFSQADIVVGTGVNVTATSATFTGALDNFAIEDRVVHKIDDLRAGLVTWVTNNVFVTPNSFSGAIVGGPTEPSIDRAIDAASAGWAVNVGVGTYTEDNGPVVVDKNVTVIGHMGQVVVQAAGSEGAAAPNRVFTVNSGVTATLTGLTIRYGDAASGGGIYNAGTLTLTNSQVVDNNATNGGGGIYNAGTLMVLGSTIGSNTATGSDGGGIYNLSGSTATLGLSTVSHNTAVNGGGLYDLNSTVTLYNTTVSGNTATGNGGGLYEDGTTTRVSSSTITANGAANGGGIFRNGAVGSVGLKSTIVAENTVSGQGPDLRGTFGSHGYNLIEALGGLTLTDVANAGTDVLDESPFIGPLADNGGGTQTHLPILSPPASPAIDRGDCTPITGAGLTVDQRGTARPIDVAMLANSSDGCDIGAVEATTTGLVRTISGTITENGAPLAGVTVTLSDDGAGTTTTDAGGTYSFDVIADGVYTVTPAMGGRQFAPASIFFDGVEHDEVASFAVTPNGVGDVDVFVTASEVVTAAAGGTVSVDVEGLVATIIIPPGALSEDTAIQVGFFDDPPGGVDVKGYLFFFGPIGTTFDPPATIIVEYDDEGMTLAEEQAMRLVRFDEATGTYEVIPGSTVNTTANTVTGATDHLSGFGGGIPVDLRVAVTPSTNDVAVGSPAAFSVTLHNDGGFPVTSAEMTLTAVANLTLAPGALPPGTSYAGGVWTIGTPLAAGGSITLPLTATPATAGPKSFTAEVTGSSNADPNFSNNTAIGQLNPELDLVLTKTVDDPAPEVGGAVVYTVTVTNDGPSTATEVVVTDDLPDGLLFVSSSDPGDYDSGTGVWNVGTLASGASATLTLTATVYVATTVTNTAVLTSYQPAGRDTDPSNDTARATFSPREENTFWRSATSAIGTVTGLAFSPSAPKTGAAGTLFVGTDGNGLYRSTDGGESFSPAGTGLPTPLYVRGVEVGDGQAVWLVSYGAGAWRSTDGGDSFTQRFGTAVSGAHVDNLLSVAVNTSSPVSGVDGDVFLGTDGSGVWYSTTDGASWTQNNTGLPASARIIRTIYVEPDGSGVAGRDRVWIGTHGGGVYRLDYLAGPTLAGATWTAANGAGATALGDLVVTDLVVDASGDLYAGTNGGVYKSTNDGATWALVLDGIVNGWESPVIVRSLLAYTVGPTQYLLAGTDGDYVYRSTDDGATWTQHTTGLQSPAVLALLHTDGVVFAGTTDRGVHRSVDNGATWEQITNEPINTVVQDIVFSGGRLYAGTYGYGVLLSTDYVLSPVLQWTEINNGLTNRQVYAMETSGARVFAGTWGGGVFRTNDGGATWQHVGLAERIVYDLARSGSTLYASTNLGEVARSVDNGLTWQEIGRAVYPFWGMIFETPTTVYGGTQGAGVYKSTDGGATWAQTGMTSGYVWDFVVGTNPVTGNPAVIAATSAGVQYSEDGGTTWTAFNTGLTVIDARTVVFAGADLLVGTWGGGVFKYDTGVDAWVRDGLPTMQILALSVDPATEEVFAATQASGVFRRPITSATAVEEEPGAAELPAGFALSQNYPNPFNPTTTIAFALPEGGAVRLAVYDVLGRVVRVLVDGALQAGTHEVVFDAGGLPSGVYFYQLEAGGHTAGRKMLLAK